MEICGIDKAISDENVEDECLKIMKAAKVKVGNRFPNTLDVHAAHRKGKKGTVIIKFVNRKFAYNAISNRANLKNMDEYKSTFINTSLCPEFGFLNYAVRRAKANGEISFYKMRNGITLIKKSENSPFVEISHENDLSRNGLTVPPRTF